MSKWVVDIHGDIEGDYEIIKEYEEPKTGHWMNRGKQGEVLPFYMRYECSICGETADKSNYCPNCGARMESEDKTE